MEDQDKREESNMPQGDKEDLEKTPPEGIPVAGSEGESGDEDATPPGGTPVPGGGAESQEDLDATIPGAYATDLQAQAAVESSSPSPDLAVAKQEDEEVLNSAKETLRSSARMVGSDRLRGQVTVVRWADIEQTIARIVREGGKGAKAELVARYESQQAELAAKAKRDQSSLGGKLSELEGRIGSQKSLLEEKLAEIEKLQAALAEKDQDIEKAKNEARALEETVRSKEDDMKAVRVEMEELQEKIKKSGGLIDEELAARAEMEKLIESQKQRLAVHEKDLSKEFDLKGRVRELELEVVTLKEKIGVLEAGLDFFALEEEFDLDGFKSAVQDVRAVAGKLSGTAAAELNSALDAIEAGAEANAARWKGLLNKVYAGEGNFYNVADLIRLAERNRSYSNAIGLIGTALGTA